MAQLPSASQRQSRWHRSLRRSLAVFAWVPVLLCLPAFCVWSSHKRVTVTILTCKHATMEPDTGVVHPYPGLSLDRLSGDLGEVWFTTDVALESLTSLTHHHYFSLLPCGYTGDALGLWNGRIFAASLSDYSSNPAATHLYKGYFPLSLQRLREHADGFGGIHVEQFIELARQRGLCIRVGGGQMWGWASLSSNDASLPVAITTGDSLVLNRGK
jgi:hypothetical protein